MALSNFGGRFSATTFAYGWQRNPDILVTNGPGVTGAGTLTLAFGYANTADGVNYLPFNVNAPITVGNGTTTETVTPTAVSAATPTQAGTTTVSATFANAHGNGDHIRSGTMGLQEALNFAGKYGGGKVTVDAGWAKMGGTTAMITAAVLPTGVTVEDTRNG